MFNLDFIETTPRIKKLKSKVLVSTIIRLKSLSVPHALQNIVMTSRQKKRCLRYARALVAMIGQQQL